jgi:cellulose 1,4-beta-cellobiosidase
LNDKRYNGVCDKDGCGLNPYRIGVKKFYGPGSTYSVDTTKPFTIVTQFVTTDGTDNGDLSEVKRFYVQNSKKIVFPKANFTGMEKVDSISNNNCKEQMNKFSDSTKFSTVGGTKAMG